MEEKFRQTVKMLINTNIKVYKEQLNDSEFIETFGKEILETKLKCMKDFKKAIGRFGGKEMLDYLEK